ncbi:MAG: DinB family protein [Vicinamibacterales bacterium]
MSMLPEQAVFLRDNAIRSLKSEQPITQRVIEAIPLDKGDYRPDDVGKSALELAWHIVLAEHRFSEAVIAGAFDFTNSGRPADLTDSAAIARWYGETTRQDVARLSALPAEALMKIVDFRGLFQLPAVAFLDFSLHHIVHHRGQLSMYLRPMGAKVPAIYGESYDSAKAKSGA